MPALEVGFEARPKAIAKLLAGDEAVDPEALASEGAPVRGLNAVEEALFGAGADEMATAGGGRRCTYVASVVDLAGSAVGDVLAIRDTGAYGSVMASNYNRRPMAAEVLVEPDGWRRIRRRQTIDDLLRWDE